jgi:Kef-type K+ transport system membrane component KefB
MTYLLQIGIIFFLGYLGALLANRVGIPKVSAYVLIGMALSPTISGIISHDFLKETTVIVDFALAMVAYTLGGQGGHLKLKGIREQGREIVFITLGQGMGAYIFVTGASFVFLYFFYTSFSLMDVAIISILFGAISLSTAPAATIATIHECKARGPFTSVLMAIVALDDALGLIFFALTLSIIKGLVMDTQHADLSIMAALVKIFYSMLMGGSIGVLLVYSIKYIDRKETLIILTVASFCLTFGLNETLGLEPLFSTMIMGLTVSNLYPDDLPFKFLEGYYEPVIFVVFFVLAGAHIDLQVLLEYFPLAILFVTFRVSGKWVGTFVSGTLAGAPKDHSKYLGMGLAPQAGIAIGLALYVQQIPSLELYGTIALNVIVAKTAINEVLGPWLLKTALHRVKEAGNHHPF